MLRVDPEEVLPTSTKTQPLTGSESMLSVQWEGTENVKVVETPKPIITEPKDAIIRVTSSTICGSDLHLYHGEAPMRSGDILGHECMGIVESVGSEVNDIKVGDKVVVSAMVCDGICKFCKQGLFSLCDTTNPSKLMEKMYGQKICGVFGYSHITGGYPGGQAEFIRVPFADVNLLKVPNSIPDEKVLFLSDVVCTGYHATELGEVKKGDVVAIWGAGPVGLLAAAWSKFKGARRVIVIDCIPYRLEVAKKLGCEIINFSEEETLSALKRLVPESPDVTIDAVGFRYPKSLLHKFMRGVQLETDSPEVIGECIIGVRKGGNVSVVGDYFGTANKFPVGALMEKGITCRGSQVHIQRYWKKLLSHIENGEFDPTFVISHTMNLEQAAEAYKLFDQKEDNILKVILKPTPTRR